jgi:hypothetical protein
LHQKTLHCQRCKVPFYAREPSVQQRPLKIPDIYPILLLNLTMTTTTAGRYNGL